MSAKLLKGAESVPRIEKRIRAHLADLSVRGIAPRLALIRFNGDKDSELYARSIMRLFEKLTIGLEDFVFSANGDSEKVFSSLRGIRPRGDLSAYLVLRPIPSSFTAEKILTALGPEKDAECAQGWGASSKEIFPPTALAVLELIRAAGRAIRGKEAVVVGRSRIAGLPVAELLLKENATVTVCHSRTRSLETHVRRADIVVAAAGKPRLIRGNWIKKGAVVIDAGENVARKKVVGDVDFEGALRRASFITPVPGGVGPLTTWCLAENVVRLASK